MGTAGRRSDVMPSSCLRGVVSVCTRHVLCMDGEHPQPLMGDDNSGACYNGAVSSSGLCLYCTPCDGSSASASCLNTCQL